MKLCSLRIIRYRQFSDISIDFTNPISGDPLEKVCFIGPNGSGKSTLLSIIAQINPFTKNKSGPKDIHLIIAKYTHGEKYLHQFFSSIFNINDWFEFANPETSIPKLIEALEYPHARATIKGDGTPDLEKKLYEALAIENGFLKGWPNSNWKSTDSAMGLLIHCLPESSNNTLVTLSDVPKTTLSEANRLFKSNDTHYVVDLENSKHFWEILMYNIAMRKAEKEKFENQPSNLNKTKKQLNEEFDKKHPEILNVVGKTWNKILEKAHMEIDLNDVRKPLVLDDNLKFYVKLKNGKSNGVRIQYKDISTGIRYFIFKLGHIQAIFFNKKINDGFLLVDEPENSLFPDFLYDLVDVYKEVSQSPTGHASTQMFFATHSPIIAAQFAPYERVILDWNSEFPGYVSAKKGKAAEGDDPNDVLKSDFGIASLMGKVGSEMWRRYIQLKSDLRVASGLEKEKIIDEMFRISSEYNFSTKE